ncbi:MAG: hypothetical protein H7Z14_10035 [Anaerolineae bacterium]|nr:hypothetical protein [Phycisphaerae bacterium]
MRKTVAASLLALTLAPFVLGVGTSRWTQTTESDFKAGTFDNVVATNLGDLKLSRATRTLLSQDARVSAVYALAETPDGSIYAATGPQGALLRVNGEKIETVAELGDNVNLFALAVDPQGRLLIGTGGEKGQIYRFEKTGEKPTSIFTSDDAQYIWSIVATADGNLYAATGPNGKLFEIHADGSNKVLFETDENNLLSMTSDGKDLLYVGSDPNGHIYRVNRKTGESFVVYDAAETEISTLALDARGNLYAGTAQSTGENIPGLEEPAADKSGRPEQDQAPAAGIPSDPPHVPDPPKLPLPGPGEPNPIPRGSGGGATTQPKSMVILPDGPTSQQQDPTDPDEPGPAPSPGKKPRRPKIGAGAPGGGIRQGPIRARDAGEPPASGNAVYKIDPEGFVTEVFRQNVLVLSLVEQNGVLLVGTGSEGMVYQINPSAEETSVVAKVDPKEVLSLLASKSGQIYMGMANNGQLSTLSAGHADKGTFTSPVLDAQQVSRFGKIRLHGTLPKETKLSVATRSGNVGETTDPGWSKWSDESPATEFVTITSPSARFLQYRLTLQSDAGKQTPVVDDVDVAYQLPNLAPQIKSIKLAGEGAASAVQQLMQGENAPGAAAQSRPNANPNFTITWEAEDPNADALEYSLYFRAAGSKNGQWILMKDKLTETTYEWNTRSIGDGRYEVKIVASDAAANPINEGRSGSRVSDPIDVDNTAPVIGEIKSTPQDGSAKMSATVVDRLSTVAGLEYAVDSATDWQAVLPADKIADSPEEIYDFVVGGLSAGDHQLTLRATDAHGNQAFETVNVSIAK